MLDTSSSPGVDNTKNIQGVRRIATIYRVSGE